MSNYNQAGGLYAEWANMGFKKNPANRQEQMIENMYIRLFTDLCASRFKWSGVPEEIDLRFLELTLFYQALSVFYFDGRYDKYMSLRANMNGYLDYQNNPTGYNVIGNNFTSVSVSALKDTSSFDKHNISQIIRKGIPIWANKQRTPDIDIVLIYAKKLANFDRTVEINSMNARMPKVVVSNENMSLTMSNLSRQIEEGQNNLKVRGNVNLEDIKALDLGIDPLAILNIDIVRDRQWNKCMTLLGIQASNQDKKERLVSDEVTANGDQTSMMQFVNLNERRHAAKIINKYYNLDIEVDYYTETEKAMLNMPTNNITPDENKDNKEIEDNKNE
jgi:hypothetical protein